MTPERRAVRRTGAGVVVVVVVVVVVAVLLSLRSSPSQDHQAREGAAARPTPVGAPAADETSSPVPGPPAAADSQTARGLRPVRVTIPAIGVDAPVDELGIAADGTIEVPDVAARTGWLDTTPAPGQQGPAVVAGHVDSTTGPAVFYRLGSLKAGDSITVTLRDGTSARFTVDGVRTYAQDDFPTGEVYGPVPGPALRLITCGGDYVESAGGYQSNVVVYAS